MPFSGFCATGRGVQRTLSCGARASSLWRYALVREAPTAVKCGRYRGRHHGDMVAREGRWNLNFSQPRYI